MKTIFVILLCNFLAISIFAQSASVNIIFNGISSTTKNYKVIFDGKSYFSNKDYNNSDDQNTVSINDLNSNKTQHQSLQVK